MAVLFLDFETYYDTEYSLRRMAPPNYILDPHYETIGCSAAVDGQPSRWIDGPDFADYLNQFNPADTATVTFNALFDNCILAWRYGFVPSRMFCTMRMAAAMKGHVLPSLSLANVSKALGLGEKGTTIHNVKGMHRADIMADPGLWRAFQDYANNDNDLNRRIFHMLIQDFPPSEWRIMDRVLRCAVEPRFHVDTDMLRKHLEDLDIEQANALAAAGVEASELRSTSKFEELLKQYGVDVEYKPSTTDPTRMIPAFSKTDEFMEKLQEHEDPVVQALAAARLGVRSTIEKTRGERIMSVAALPWRYTTGTMPIPLRYGAAHTHRLGGDWSLNMQNLPSGRGKVSKLRKALIAPPGYKVIVADKAQIECRITALICRQFDLLDQFRNGQDPYSILGSKVFGFKVDKNIHTMERFIGKTGVLGLGFGCGHDKFYNMVVRSGRLLGMDMGALMGMWDPLLAQKTVTVYREANRGIVASWRKLGEILDTAWCGAAGPVRWGPVMIGHGYVEGPGGLRMVYDVLPKDQDGHRYKYGRGTHKMYGAKFLENIVQFLARIDLMDGALRLWDRGYRFAHQAHDELVFLVPDADVDNAKKIIHEEMTRSPMWAPDLPLAAEVGVGQSYGDAK